MPCDHGKHSMTAILLAVSCPCSCQGRHLEEESSLSPKVNNEHLRAPSGKGYFQLPPLLMLC